MERYQRRKYPALTHSHVEHGLDAQNLSQEAHRSEKERQRQRRLKHADMSSEKERVRSLLLRGLSEQTSLEALSIFLKTKEFSFYQRGEKTFGIKAVQSGRKYRLKTLGVWPDFEQARQNWAKVPARLHTLDQQSIENNA